MTLSVRTDRRYVRAIHRSTRYLLATVTAPSAAANAPRRSVNLAFVLDRSGSMAGDKIRLARAAVEDAIGRLRADDRFAVVAYDDRVDVVVPGSLATPDARSAAIERIRSIDARDSTDLAGGWLRGCEQVATDLRPDGVNRCLLLTDGLANVGMTDPDELRHHAGELRARGVSTTTFGVGRDFDEVLLAGMAEAGAGHFYFIAEGSSIPDYMTSEVGETLAITARDVVLDVSAPAGVEIEALTAFPTSLHDDRTRVALGDLSADQEVEIVLRLRFPYGESGRAVRAVVAASDRDGVLAGGTLGVTWEHADDATNDRQARDLDVDRAVARVFAARAVREAATRNRTGDYEGARDVIAGTARRIRAYAGSDAEIAGTLAALEARAPALGGPMPELARKAMYSTASYAEHSRMPTGVAATRAPGRHAR